MNFYLHHAHNFRLQKSHTKIKGNGYKQCFLNLCIILHIQAATSVVVIDIRQLRKTTT